MLNVSEDNYNNGSGNLDWLTRSFWTTPTQPVQASNNEVLLQAEELPQRIPEEVEAQPSSETDNRVKTKLMSMWNNVKYGLCEQSFYSFSNLLFFFFLYFLSRLTFFSLILFLTNYVTNG